jgi:hypothetical protein
VAGADEAVAHPRRGCGSSHGRERRSDCALRMRCWEENRYEYRVRDSGDPGCHEFPGLSLAQDLCGRSVIGGSLHVDTELNTELQNNTEINWVTPRGLYRTKYRTNGRTFYRTELGLLL